MQYPSDLIWALLAIAGVVTIPLGFILSRSDRRTWEWPITTARITKMELETTVEKTVNGTQYVHRIEYAFEYTVDDQNFLKEHSKKWSEKLEDTPKAIEFKDWNSVGKEFDVIFNPDQPSRVFTDEGDDPRGYGPRHLGDGRVLSAFGVLAIVMGVLLLMVDVKWFVPVPIAVAGILAAKGVHTITYYPFEAYAPLDPGNATKITRRT